MRRTIVNPIIKDTVTFLQTDEESGGKVTETDITLMPKGGNPLHYHKTYSETFTAIEGELGVKLGGKETKILKPGKPIQLNLCRCIVSLTQQTRKLNSMLNLDQDILDLNTH